MVSMVAFQAVDPGSIPGHRIFLLFLYATQRQRQQQRQMVGNVVRTVEMALGFNAFPFSFEMDEIHALISIMYHYIKNKTFRCLYH